MHCSVHSDCESLWQKCDHFEETRYFCHLFRKMRSYSAFLLLKHIPSTSFFFFFFTLITLFSSNATACCEERKKKERRKPGGPSSALVKADGPTPVCQANCLQYGPETQSTSILAQEKTSGSCFLQRRCRDAAASKKEQIIRWSQRQ